MLFAVQVFLDCESLDFLQRDIALTGDADAVFVLRNKIHNPSVEPGHFDRNAAKRCWHHDDFPFERGAPCRVPAYPDRGGFLKNDTAQTLGSIHWAKYLEKLTRTSLFHQDRTRRGVQRASIQKPVRDIGEILRRHVVDIRLDHFDFIDSSLRSLQLWALAFIQQQTKAIWKILKLLCAGAVAYAVDGQSIEQGEFRHHSGQDGSTGGR